MRNTFFIIIFILSLGFQALAQKTLISRDVDRQMARMNDTIWGPNASHFICRTFDVGYFLPVNYSDTLGVKNGLNSFWISVGTKYKKKFNETFSGGIDFSLAMQQFRIRQVEANPLSLGKINDKQTLGLYSIALGAYLRINFGKRGNRLGRYFDLGGDAHWIYHERLFAKNNTDPSKNNGSKKEKMVQSNLDYINPLQTYAYFKFGINRLVLFGRYRINDLFQASDNINSGKQLPNLPNVIVGIELIGWGNSGTDYYDDDY